MLDEYYSYDLLHNHFIESFIEDYGNLKSEDIANKVYKSESIRKLILTASNIGFLPKGQILTESLLGTRYFMFSKTSTVMFAAMIALKRCIEELEEFGLVFSEEEKLNAAKSVITTGRQI